MPKPDTTRVDQQIAKVKARLSELYAKRREIIAANKPPKRMSSDDREKQIAALALSGANVSEIAEKLKLHKNTVRHHIWHSVWHAARKELGKDASYHDLEAKELELRPRLCPNVKWRTGNYNTGPRQTWLLLPRQRIMYRNNDGSIMGYFYSDGTPAPDKAESA